MCGGEVTIDGQPESQNVRKTSMDRRGTCGGEGTIDGQPESQYRYPVDIEDLTVYQK